MQDAAILKSKEVKVRMVLITYVQGFVKRGEKGSPVERLV